eukprot:jgi/Botrbrau1/2127/Bobra.0093s0034.1
MSLVGFGGTLSEAASLGSKGIFQWPSFGLQLLSYGFSFYWVKSGSNLEGHRGTESLLQQTGLQKVLAMAEILFPTEGILTRSEMISLTNSGFNHDCLCGV